MNHKMLVSELYKLGLSKREARIYLALLDKSESNASELHRLSGITRTKIYEILQQMINKGYCISRSEGRNKTYLPVEPNRLKEILISNLKTQADEERKKLEKQKEALINKVNSLEQRQDEVDSSISELNIDFRNKIKQNSSVFGILNSFFTRETEEIRSFDFIEIIRNQDQIHSNFVRLMKESNEEMLAFNRSPYAALADDMIEEQVRVQREFHERGGRIRAILMFEEDIIEYVNEIMKEDITGDDQTRITDSLPVKMFIFDREIVMTTFIESLPGSDPEYTMLIIRDKSFAKFCTAGFEYYWSESEDLESFLARKIS